MAPIAAIALWTPKGHAEDPAPSLPVPQLQYHSAGKRISEEESQFRAIIRQVSSALESGNADELERLASDLLSRHELTPAGAVPIHSFHQAMEVYLGEGPGGKGVSTGHPLNSILSTVHVWQKKYPNSAAAFVSEGSLLLSHALGARGETSIDQVPSDKLLEFESNLDLARVALMSSKAIGKGDPIWYETMLTAGQYSGMERNAYVDLVDEGMHAYPNDFDMAEMGLFYMFPVWGGSRKEIAAYVEHALTQASTENAPLVASRIYYALVHGGKFAGPDMANMLHTGVDQIEQAMALLVARYPDAINFDKQAVVTCALGDKPKLRLQLSEIGDSPLVWYWDNVGKGYYFLLCRRYAGLN